MKKLAFVAALSLSTFATPVLAQTAMADRATLQQDVTILADDDMEGREAGTAGYDRAVEYISGRFAEIGLQPAGDNGAWTQAVPLVRVSSARASQVSMTDADGSAIPVAFGRDLVGRGQPGMDANVVDAELVFVGYGLDLPDAGYDDLGSVDLEGKIAVYIWGVPDGLPSDQAAVLQSNTLDRFARHGAVGAIMIWNDNIGALAPWEAVRRFFSQGEDTTWVAPDGMPYNSATGVEFSMFASPDLSRKMLEGHEFDLDAMNAALAEDAPMPSFAIGKSATVDYANKAERFDTSNVIGLLPGTDPSVANEYVVVTAHLDHEGISATPQPDGDDIFNGAMDNATGVAAITETARLLAANPGRRPVLFVALGAEELGLLGSSYHAANPGLPEGGELVANVNMDMPILTWPFSDIVAFGSERSNLLAPTEAAVSEYGLVLAEDPNPEEMFFVRSDQYSYVRNGIPAVYVDLGWGNDGEAAQTAFLETHYHKPSDEIEHLDWEQLGRFTDVGYLVTRNIANMADRPAWNYGDFFGISYGGTMQDAE